jgi:hypothetical protein
MAVEVDHNRYLFMITERQQEKSKYKAADFTVFMEKLRNRNNAPPKATETRETHHNTGIAKEPRPFRYNPTHDLESLWWIAIYFVANKETFEVPDAARADYYSPDNLSNLGQEVGVAGTHVVKSNVGEQGIHAVGSVALTDSPTSDTFETHTTSQLTETQLKYARSLFYGRETRWLALQLLEDNPLDNHLRSLPTHLSRVYEPLIELRTELRLHYHEIERLDFKIDKMVAESLYASFINAFTTILETLEQRDIMVTPLRRDPQEEGLRKVAGRGAEASQGASQSTGHTGSTSSKRKGGEQADSSAGSKKSKVDHEA